MPGDEEQHKGPNIAAVQSMLDATESRRAEEAGGPDEDHDKSALALASAVMATPSEAMKSNIPGVLTGGLMESVVSVGVNMPKTISIFGPSKGTSLFFGFPVLFDSHSQSGAGEDSHGGDGGEGASDTAGEAGGGGSGGDDEDERYRDYKEGGEPHDPFGFNEYPHTNQEIAHASHGMGGVSHEGEEEIDKSRSIAPSPSPGMDHGGHDSGRSL